MITRLGRAAASCVVKDHCRHVDAPRGDETGQGLAGARGPRPALCRGGVLRRPGGDPHPDRPPGDREARAAAGARRGGGQSLCPVGDRARLRAGRWSGRPAGGRRGAAHRLRAARVGAPAGVELQRGLLAGPERAGRDPPGPPLEPGRPRAGGGDTGRHGSCSPGGFCGPGGRWPPAALHPAVAHPRRYGLVPGSVADSGLRGGRAAGPVRAHEPQHSQGRKKRLLVLGDDRGGREVRLARRPHPAAASLLGRVRAERGEGEDDLALLPGSARLRSAGGRLRPLGELSLRCRRGAGRARDQPGDLRAQGPRGHGLRGRHRRAGDPGAGDPRRVGEPAAGRGGRGAASSRGA